MEVEVTTTTTKPVYTHPTVMRYNESGQPQTVLKLHDESLRRRLLDAIDDVAVPGIIFYMYNVRLNRYSLLVLRDSDGKVRLPSWTNQFCESDDTGPRQLVQELNYHQLSRGGHHATLIYNGLYGAHSLKNSSPLPPEARTYANKQEALDLHHAGYDMAIDVLAMERATLQAMRSEESTVDEPWRLYQTYAKERWPPLLLYHALLRVAGPRVAIAPPIDALERGTRSVRSEGHWYVRPRYTILRAYTPLTVTLDEQDYVMDLYPDVDVNTGALPLSGGLTDWWYAPYHLQKLVYQLSLHADRWYRKAQRLARGHERDAYVRECFQSLSFGVTIVEQGRMEAMRLDSLRWSRLLTLRMVTQYNEKVRRLATNDGSAKQPRYNDADDGLLALAQTMLLLAKTAASDTRSEGDEPAEPAEADLVVAVREQYRIVANAVASAKSQ